MRAAAVHPHDRAPARSSPARRPPILLDGAAHGLLEVLGRRLADDPRRDRGIGIDQRHRRGPQLLEPRERRCRVADSRSAVSTARPPERASEISGSTIWAGANDSHSGVRPPFGANENPPTKTGPGAGQVDPVVLRAAAESPAGLGDLGEPVRPGRPRPPRPAPARTPRSRRGRAARSRTSGPTAAEPRARPPTTSVAGSISTVTLATRPSAARRSSSAGASWPTVSGTAPR